MKYLAQSNSIYAYKSRISYWSKADIFINGMTTGIWIAIILGGLLRWIT